jgi:predicted adenylyl cyclase CyaB
MSMARNIEIKARVESVETLAERVAAIADEGPIVMFQDDTFFMCERGRMKLRAFSATEGQLIFYQRPNAKGPKESCYIISPTAVPDSLREALSLAYGQAGRVRKLRTLYVVGRTRVHLDQVEGLGQFVELEVVLSDGEGTRPGIEEAEGLVALLGISSAQLVDEAYVDLLAQRQVFQT